MNMNKIALTLLTGILTALSLVSCMDDEMIKTGNVVEGKPVTVTMQLAFTQPSDIVVTRADDNTLSDLSNLIIIVYKQESTGSTSFECMYSSNLTNESPKYKKLTFNKSETIEGGVLYSVSFAATSGNKKLIAIANTGADDQAGRIWDLTSLQNNSTSFDNLKEAVIKLQDRLYTTPDNVRPIQITSSSQMLMTGLNENISFDTSGNVVDLDKNKVAVKLDRAMARIKFNIVAKPKNAKGTFTPSSYRIYNIPVNSYLTNTEKKQTTMITEEETNFIHTSSANIGAVSGGNYSFSFYMPENINALKNITNTKTEINGSRPKTKLVPLRKIRHGLTPLRQVRLW